MVSRNFQMIDLRRLLLAASLVALLMIISLLELEASCSKHNDRRRRKTGGPFMLHKPEEVVRTEAGAIRVSRVASGKREDPSPFMHVGFIDMEPNSLFVPQYLDSTLILFLRSGKLKVGRIYQGDLVIKVLKVGDIYHIPAGTTFFMVNIGIREKVQIICSIDPSQGLGVFPFQPFLIGGGGKHPASVLWGFHSHTLSTAFNATYEEMRPLLEGRALSPISWLEDEASHQPRMLSSLLMDGASQNCVALKSKERNLCWPWNYLLSFFDANFGKKKGSTPVAPDAYNLFDREPDFRNAYGSITTVDEDDYPPLKHPNIGIYHINLSAEAMVAPHLNPMATEYGTILVGSGDIQVVFPNGSSGMRSEITEGDSFWVPRYFPVSYVASKRGPMEVIGFTTSSRKGRSQFLTGAKSVLLNMRGPELAAAFGASDEEMEKVVGSQREAYIIPTWVETSERREEEEEERYPPAAAGEHTMKVDIILVVAALLFLGSLQMFVLGY